MVMEGMTVSYVPAVLCVVADCHYYFVTFLCKDVTMTAWQLYLFTAMCEPTNHRKKCLVVYIHCICVNFCHIDVQYVM